MGIVVLGLDGADPELVEQWIDDLPAFQQLHQDGFLGTLDSIEPPITVPAWMSMFASQDPEQYGCYDFTTVTAEYSATVVDSSYFTGRTHLNGEDVISFRVPGTTPGQDIDGVLVTGFVMGEESQFYPEEIEDRVREHFNQDIQKLRGNQIDKQEIASHNFQQNMELFTWLLEEYEFRTAYSVFRLIDTHMHNHDHEHDLKDAYEEADKALGQLIEHCQDNDHDLLVVSDHGSTQTTRKLYLNSWLEDQGYLQKEKTADDHHLLYAIGSGLMDLGLKPVLRKANNLLSQETGISLNKSKESVLEETDFTSTEAFCYISGVSNYGAIWINDDRFRDGNVEDRAATAAQIADELKDEDYIRKATTKWVEHDDMPDIIVKADDDIVVGSETFPSLFHKSSATVHGLEGLIGGIGPHMASTDDISAHLLDIGTTIDALHGSVDADSDGNVIEDILEDTDYNVNESLDDIDI